MNIEQELPKQEILGLIDSWLIEREAYQITPAHPLVTAQELRLEEGGVMGGPKQTRASGRSKPPIREMRGGCGRTDKIMSHIRDVNEKYYNALIAYTLVDTIEEAWKATGQKNKAETFRNIQEGMVVFRSAYLLI